MPRLHALELLPDDDGEAAVRADWQALRDAGLPSQLDHAGETNTPHVTVVAVPAPRRPGEVYRSCLDVRRSVAELRLDRPVPLVEGLRRTLGWIRSR